MSFSTGVESLRRFLRPIEGFLGRPEGRPNHRLSHRLMGSQASRAGVLVGAQAEFRIRK